MELTAQQAENRYSYVGGGVGLIVSAIGWLLSAYVLKHHGLEKAFYVLFAWGFLIFPVGVLLCKALFKRPAPSKSNKLGLLALESTLAMIAGLFVAWMLLKTEPGLVFPVAALSVGAHFFIFNTVYGDRVYWVLAALICLPIIYQMLGYCAILGQMI